MKIGRNDPCPCGSGKKYKKCCMNEETAKRPRSISDSDRSSDAWNGAEMEFAMLQAEDMIPFGKQRTARERIMALEDILVGCPDYYPAGFELGARLIMTGDPERYEKIIDRALEVMKERGEKPGDISKAIEFVCEVLEKYFRYSDAIRYYEQLADIETEDRWRASAHSDISNCCFYLDDSERALREAEEAVAITPNSCKQLSNLGWIRMTRDELEPAKEVLKRAVKIDASDPIARSNLKACNIMRKKHLKSWDSLLLRGYDRKSVERLTARGDLESAEMALREHNGGLLQAFRLHLARDGSRTPVEKYDLYFTLTYVLDILGKVNFDEDLLFSDIITVEVSMERFLAKLIVTTSDIDDEIYDANIDALLEFYRFLETNDVVDDLSDLEEEVEEYKEEFRSKMHEYDPVRRAGDPERKQEARDTIFNGLLWF